MSQQSRVLSRFIPKQKAWTIVDSRIALLVIGLVVCVLVALVVYVSSDTSGPATADADVASLAASPELMFARRYTTAEDSPWAAILDAIPAPLVASRYATAKGGHWAAILNAVPSPRLVRFAAMERGRWAALLDAIPAPQISDDFVAAANRAAEMTKSEQATSARWSALGAHHAAMRSEAAAAASSARYNALAAFYGLGEAVGASRSRELAANPELMVAHRYAIVEHGIWAGSWTRSLCRGLPNPAGPC